MQEKSIWRFKPPRRCTVLCACLILLCWCATPATTERELFLTCTRQDKTRKCQNATSPNPDELHVEENEAHCCTPAARPKCLNTEADDDVLTGHVFSRAVHLISCALVRLPPAAWDTISVVKRQNSALLCPSAAKQSIIAEAFISIDNPDLRRILAIATDIRCFILKRSSTPCASFSALFRMFPAPLGATPYQNV